MNIDKELDPVYIYVPSTKQIVSIIEGSGDNLSKEDREEGYIDYIYFTQFSLNQGDISEVDGGILMKKKFLRDTYKSLIEAVPEVLEMAYDSSDIKYLEITGVNPD